MSGTVRDRTLIRVRVRVRGGVTSHSRSPDGGECGICGGVLVEMCTETPQSQRSIKIQNMLTEMLHPPASIVVRTRSLDLVRQLCGVPGHCLLEHPPD